MAKGSLSQRTESFHEQRISTASCWSGWQRGVPGQNIQGSASKRWAQAAVQLIASGTATRRCSAFVWRDTSCCSTLKVAATTTTTGRGDVAARPSYYFASLGERPVATRRPIGGCFLGRFSTLSRAFHLDTAGPDLENCRHAPRTGNVNRDIQRPRGSSSSQGVSWSADFVPHF
jgi:hypothetical protein